MLRADPQALTVLCRARTSPLLNRRERFSTQ
jgi:hypothetical protein